MSYFWKKIHKGKFSSLSRVTSGRQIKMLFYKPAKPWSSWAVQEWIHAKILHMTSGSTGLVKGQQEEGKSITVSLPINGLAQSNSVLYWIMVSHEMTGPACDQHSRLPQLCWERYMYLMAMCLFLVWSLYHHEEYQNKYYSLQKVPFLRTYSGELETLKKVIREKEELEYLRTVNQAKQTQNKQ